jgi:hypothetical protein
MPSDQNRECSLGGFSVAAQELLKQIRVAARHCRAAVEQRGQTLRDLTRPGADHSAVSPDVRWLFPYYLCSTGSRVHYFWHFPGTTREAFRLH